MKTLARLLLVLGGAAHAAPRLDVLAGTWRDDLTDLSGIEENRQGTLVTPAGYTIDPGIQTYSNPYHTTGFSQQFSAPGALAGDTLRYENPGASTERLTLWSAIYQPFQQFSYAYDCIYNLTGYCGGGQCPCGILQNGDFADSGIVNAPYAGTSMLFAVGWDTSYHVGTWMATGKQVGVLNCREPTGVLADGNALTASIAGFYQQPLMDGLSIDALVPGREYTATFLAGLLRGSNHENHSTTSYLFFEFQNLDTKASFAGSTLYEGQFLNGSLPTLNAGTPNISPIGFGEMTPVAIHLGAADHPAKAEWDLRAISLVPPGGHNHCTALGPAWLVADRATYASPVFDSGSDFTRWVDICWDVDMSTLYVDSSKSPIPIGSPITPIRLGYGVSSVQSPILPVSWTVSHGGEGIAGLIGRNMIAQADPVTGHADERCNLMQDAKGAPLVGRYFQWSATLFSRHTAQEVDPDLEPADRPIFFGGFRPAIERVTVHYYVCSAFARSSTIAPPGVARWKTLEYLVEHPSGGSSVVVDVLSGVDGSVLIAGAAPGASLAGINPLVHPSLVLRATLESDPADCDKRPVLRGWQASWEPMVDVILVSCNAIRPALGETCRMQLRVERPGRGVVEVHDAAGQLVTTLLDDDLWAGARLLAWDGRGRSGDLVAPGVYFLHARVPGGRRVVRLAVLR